MPDEMKTCKDCGRVFVITEAQQAWIEARGFSAFERCEDCRQARRALMMVKMCKDCGQTFGIGKGELDWLESRGWKPFERCRACRERKKAGLPPKRAPESFGEFMRRKAAHG